MSDETPPPSPPRSSQADRPQPGVGAAQRRWMWAAYALGALLLPAILFVRLAFGFNSGDPPTMILFVLPIILSAAGGGLAPGLAATLLAALLTSYFLLPPLYSFSIASALQSIQWGGLIIAGALVSVLCEGLHRARRRAEDSQQLQALTLASIGDAVIATDARGQISLFNAEAERLTGWPNQDALGQPATAIFQVINAQSRAPIAGLVEHILRTGAAIGSADQIVLLARDGREIPIDTSGVPIRQAGGAVSGAILVFRDVSARIQVEDMQRRLAAIVESSYDAIVSKDLDGIVTSWNAGAERIFGYSQREMIGQSITRIIPLDRHEEEVTILARIRHGERVEHFDTVRRRQDGELIDVSITVSPIRDSQGRIIGASKVARDIGERKRAELVLRQSEARFATAFRSSPAAMSITRLRDGSFVDINLSYERLFGYRRAELIGQRADAVDLYADLSQRAEIVRIMREQGLLHNAELKVRTRSGEYREVLFSLESLELDGDTCILSILFDITDRKRAELALQRHTERLQHLHAIDRAILAQDSPVAIAQATIEHIALLVPSTRIALVLIDMGAQTITLAALQLRGEIQHLPNVSAPLAMSADMLDQLQRGEVYHVADVAALGTLPELLRVAQAEHLRAFFITPILAGGELVATFNVGADTPDAFLPEHIEIVREVADQVSIAIQQAQLRTQVERYAHELEQRVVARTAELEATNKELEAFSYSVSHDLRAPLRAIDGFTRILLDEYVAVLPEEAQRYFQLVRGSAQQMGRLIDDLLAFSRLGRQPLNTRLVDMTALVRQCLDDLRVEQVDRAVECRIGVLPACQGDPTLLKQVWMNLLSNALKYTRRRDPAIIEITSQPADQETIYVVKDNGVGFDMRYSGKLFGVFQRLHRAEDYEGTGVGLAIVLRIVHRHGGRIWAEAAIDAGATFYFTLGDTSYE